MFEKKEISIDLCGDQYPLSLYCGGKGPTILFVHGWNHSSAIWAGAMRTLANSYRTVSVDLPGFGTSPPLPRQLITMDHYASLVRGVIDRITQREELAMIVGDSLGARLILCSIVSQGPVPCRVALSGCPVDGLPRGIRLLRARGCVSALMWMTQRTPRSISACALKRVARLTVHAQSDVNKAIVEGAMQAHPNTAEQLFRALCTPASQAELTADIPTGSIVIRGEFDRIVASCTSKKLAEMLRCRYVVIPSVGHTPMVEDVNGYVGALAAGLD